MDQIEEHEEDVLIRMKVEEIRKNRSLAAGHLYAVAVGTGTAVALDAHAKGESIFGSSAAGSSSTGRIIGQAANRNVPGGNSRNALSGGAAVGWGTSGALGRKYLGRPGELIGQVFGGAIGGIKGIGGYWKERAFGAHGDESVAELEPDPLHAASGISDEYIGSIFPSITRHQITRGAEVAEGPGYQFTFPSGSMEEGTLVEVFTMFDESLWPLDFVGITPIIDVQIHGELKKSVGVELDTICVPGGQGGAGAPVMATVFHMGKQGRRIGAWDEITVTPVRDDGTVSFVCEDFSPIFVAIRNAFSRSIALPLRVAVYSSEGGNIRFYLALRHKTIKRKLAKNFVGTENAKFDLIYVKIGDKVKCGIKPHSRSFKIVPDGVKTITIDENILRVRKYPVIEFNVALSPKSDTQGPARVALECSLLCEDQTNQTQGFNHDWTPPTALAAQLPSRTNVANIIVENSDQANLRIENSLLQANTGDMNQHGPDRIVYN